MAQVIRVRPSPTGYLRSGQCVGNRREDADRIVTCDGIDTDVVRAGVEVGAQLPGNSVGVTMSDERVDEAIATVSGQIVVGESQPPEIAGATSAAPASF